MTDRTSRLVCVAIAAFIAFALAMFTGDSRVASVWLAVSGGLWWAACVLARRDPLRPRWIWCWALALRLAAFSAGPRFSDDIHRYLWEGEVILDGGSPYASPPASPQLAALRARVPELASRVNHPEVPATYPPMVQACGALAALVERAAPGGGGSAGLLTLRLLFVAADLTVLAVLLRASRRRALLPEAGIVWGWCPLVCLEFAGSGHLDSLGILWLALGLLVAGESSLRAGLVTGLGIATKFLPVLLLPWLWRAGRDWRRWARPLLASAVGLGGYLPFVYLAGGESAVAGGLQQYGERWEASSLVYRFVEPLVRAHLVAPDAPPESARHLARILVALVWFAFAAWTMVRVADPWRGCGRLLGAFLILSPTLHPWYLLWMLPFLARQSSRAWSWILAVAGLAYWPIDRWQSEQVWIEPAWLWWTIVPVFASLGAWDLLEQRHGVRREAD